MPAFPAPQPSQTPKDVRTATPAGDATVRKQPTSRFDPVTTLVAQKFDITVEHMRRAVTDRRAVEARKLAAALALRRYHVTPQEISDHFGLVEAAVTAAATTLDSLFVDFALSHHAPLLDIVDFLVQHWFERSASHASYYAIADIQDEVCAAFEVSRMDLLSPRRAANLACARQIAMALAKHLTKRSYPEIGRRFERDHTTVLHAVRKRQTLIDALAGVVRRDAPLAEWVGKAKTFVERGLPGTTEETVRSESR
jgi:chromosomal replication initiation ATPase DnaA